MKKMKWFAAILVVLALILTIGAAMAEVEIGENLTYTGGYLKICTISNEIGSTFSISYTAPSGEVTGGEPFTIQYAREVFYRTEAGTYTITKDGAGKVGEVTIIPATVTVETWPEEGTMYSGSEPAVPDGWVLAGGNAADFTVKWEWVPNGAIDVGVYLAKVTIKVKDSAIGNYTGFTDSTSHTYEYTSESNLLTIYKLSLKATVTWADNFNGIYDGSAHGITVTLEPYYAEDTIPSGETPTATATVGGQETQTNAADYTVVVTLDDDNATNSNYEITSTSPSTLTISPAAVTVAAWPVATTVPYDGSTPEVPDGGAVQGGISADY